MKKCLFGILCSALLISAMSIVPSGASAAADDSISPLEPNPNLNKRGLYGKDYYKIVVDIDKQLVSVLRQDDKGKHSIIERQMVCSTARKGKVTPIGKFAISTQNRWLYSPATSSHPTDLWEQFACRINGKIWIHSTCFTKRNSVRSLDKDSYLQLGEPVSAGCIRLCVRDAAWIFVNCPAGTAVEVKKSGGLPAVCPGELPPLPEGATYDPTDPAVLG